MVKSTKPNHRRDHREASNVVGIEFPLGKFHNSTLTTVTSQDSVRENTGSGCSPFAYRMKIRPWQ